MKLTKETNQIGINIILADGNKYIMFSYGGNLDLYLSIHSKGKDKQFIITKENYQVYQSFCELFNDIENMKIYDCDDYIPFYIETEEEKETYLMEIARQYEDDKIRYSLYNKSNYNELFDKENRTVTWYSDETAHEVANILKIKQHENIFVLDFFVQPYVDGYDEDFHTESYIPIRFRNSGSSYEPFNIIFMRMYHKLKMIDDINDIGHQIHLEEYLHDKTKVLINK